MSTGYEERVAHSVRLAVGQVMAAFNVGVGAVLHAWLGWTAVILFCVACVVEAVVIIGWRYWQETRR